MKGWRVEKIIKGPLTVGEWESSNIEDTGGIDNFPEFMKLYVRNKLCYSFSELLSLYIPCILIPSQFLHSIIIFSLLALLFLSLSPSISFFLCSLLAILLGTCPSWAPQRMQGWALKGCMAQWKELPCPSVGSGEQSWGKDWSLDTWRSKFKSGIF